MTLTGVVYISIHTGWRRPAGLREYRSVSARRGECGRPPAATDVLLGRRLSFLPVMPSISLPATYQCLSVSSASAAAGAALAPRAAPPPAAPASGIVWRRRARTIVHARTSRASGRRRCRTSVQRIESVAVAHAAQGEGGRKAEDSIPTRFMVGDLSAYCKGE